MMFVSSKVKSPGCLYLPSDTYFSFIFFMDRTAWEVKNDPAKRKVMFDPCVHWTKDGWIYLQGDVLLRWDSEHSRRPIIDEGTGYWVCSETGNRITAVKINWYVMQLSHCFS